MSLSEREPETGLPTEIDLDGGGGEIREPAPSRAILHRCFFFNANDRNLLPALYCFSM